MSDWQPRPWQHPDGSTRFALFRAPAPDDGALVPARVTAAGAAWLASAAPAPQRVLALWAARPEAPAVLPCGTAFDVISAPGVFGRRLLDRLWSEGPGSGPVAVHRGRLLLFTEPGTARRLPALLAGTEWGAALPPLLCHGTGDTVTVPPLRLPASALAATARPRPRPSRPPRRPPPRSRNRCPRAGERRRYRPSGALPLAGGTRRPASLAARRRGAAVGLLRALPGGAAAGRPLPAPALAAPTGAC
nr:bifunctional DNA primase/polymerase [Streptomyces sp. MNU89]